jgi:hypothetical protein
MSPPRYPALYQANTRVWMTEISRQLGRPASLDDIRDAELDWLAAQGFDWLYLLGVWTTGVDGRRVSRANPEWRSDFQRTLPDLVEDDICGSCFAVKAYRVHPDLGGDAALARLRGRLGARGLHLMLDFVPNHTALDHPWVKSHPDYYLQGTPDDLANQPQNYINLRTGTQERILAYGRDPYFPGWPDTLQLNYANPALQAAMRGELRKAARLCDGLRCDMAMLVLPEVFERTWGQRPEPFWSQAIAGVRQDHPDFTFMAEVYWDLEWVVQQLGFDYAYDKRLYDRLRARQARPVREHLSAGLDFQDRLARFLENHDEPRAADTFPAEVYRAAVVITFLAPGLRFFHQGQLEGRRVKISPHLCRGPQELHDPSLEAFYERLLACLRLETVRDGAWSQLEARPAWDGNPTWDNFIASAWRGPDGSRLLAIANYAPQRSQCYLELPFPELPGRNMRLIDRLGLESYERSGEVLYQSGLYLDLPGWGFHVFDLLSG